jgi:hypothetical protein
MDASVTLRRVEAIFMYRGRAITPEAVAFVRAQLVAHPGVTRRALSRQLCDAWEWRQPNGTLCDALCRSLLLRLHRAGHVTLPPGRWTPGVRRRPQPAPVLVDRTVITGPLAALRPLTFHQVRRTPDERLVDSLLAQYHYLGYQYPVGEHLKYLVEAQGRPVGCVTWSSAPRHLGARDRFIGWSPEVRRRNLRLVAYNTRFLILPWVQVPHLASHVLGRMAPRVAADWRAVHGHPIYFLETFVDPARFRGTCYRAANWIVLGRTTGRGKAAPSLAPTRSIKEILGLPLTPDFRARLTA